MILFIFRASMQSRIELSGLITVTIGFIYGVLDLSIIIFLNIYSISCPNGSLELDSFYLQKCQLVLLLIHVHIYLISRVILKKICFYLLINSCNLLSCTAVSIVSCLYSFPKFIWLHWESIKCELAFCPFFVIASLCTFSPQLIG